MKIKPHSRLLTADWVLPVSEAPIKSGAILFTTDASESVSGSTSQLPSIEWIGKKGDLTEKVLNELGDRVRNYGNCLITPGLINLHTHLDYSLLQATDVDSALFEWMGNLLEGTADWSLEMWRQSAQYGVKACVEAGTTTIVDSSFTGNSIQEIARIGLRALVGLELFGSSEEHAASIWQQWLAKYEKYKSSEDPTIGRALSRELLTLTVAPHAPYTVSPTLWRQAQLFCEEHNLPLTAHIAESSQECQWIKSGNIELDTYLAFVRSLFAAGSQSLKEYDYLKQVRDTSWRGQGGTPVEHLHKHKLLDKNTLAVHMVHTSQSDLQIIKQTGASIAHCPRSNSRLRNGRAPLEEFISAEIPFAFGTDSLASCDDLDLRQEVKTAIAIHRACVPDLGFDDAAVLRTLTLEAAEILGLDKSIGSLEVGKKPDIAVFQLKLKTENPVRAFLHGQAPVKDVFIDGQWIVQDGHCR